LPEVFITISAYPFGGSSPALKRDKIAPEPSGRTTSLLDAVEVPEARISVAIFISH